MEDPALAKARADIAEAGFRDGVAAGRWRVRADAIPTLDVEVLGVGNDGDPRWWGFRLVLDNYPTAAPWVRIWDFVADAPLDRSQRPNKGVRVTTSFQWWSEDTVYRPWERFTGPHNNNALNNPTLAWRSDRTLAFVLEDIHGLLNTASRQDGARTAA